MNSIDAIIAMCIFFAAIGTILGAINEQNKSMQYSALKADAKSNAIKCASIIDAIASNTADKYAEALECDGNKNTILFDKKGAVKTARIITQIRGNEALAIQIHKHYLD